MSSTGWKARLDSDRPGRERPAAKVRKSIKPPSRKGRVAHKNRDSAEQMKQHGIRRSTPLSEASYWSSAIRKAGASRIQEVMAELWPSVIGASVSDGEAYKTSDGSVYHPNAGTVCLMFGDGSGLTRFAVPGRPKWVAQRIGSGWVEAACQMPALQKDEAWSLVVGEQCPG